jgi:hypothetical protein
MDVIKKNMATAGSSQGRAKNRAPAPIQITAEQLLHEALERDYKGKKEEKLREEIKTADELAGYRRERRKVRVPGGSSSPPASTLCVRAEL